MSARLRIVYSIQVALFLLLLPIFFLLLLPYTRIRVFIKRLFRLKPNILWGPEAIINISHNRRADRVAGYKSDCLVYMPSRITQKDFFDYHLERFFGMRYVTIIVPFAIMLWACIKYDIFHFYYSGGFLHAHPWLIRAEFVLWRCIGKCTIISAYGGDVRQDGITRRLGKYHAFSDMTHEEVVQESKQTDEDIAGRIQWIMKWSNISLSMGDMIEYTPGSRNDIFYWPIDTADWKPVPQEDRKEVVILHAPNHPHYKGTRHLFSAIERLKREGYPIRFILIQNMKNEEARYHYEQADIIAEQFIIGWHGFFAIEAMALGKPVLCYIRKHEYLPSWAECPIVNTNPDNLYDNLVRLITNPQLRTDIGNKGREYVEKVFSLEAAGKRFRALYQELW